MFPLGFLLGTVAGVGGVLILGPQFAENARPVAKAVLKAALLAIHEVQVRGAEIVEAADDLVAEAKAELVAEAFAASSAAQAGSEPAPSAAGNNGSASKEGSPHARAQPLRKRTAVKRSRTISRSHG
jgi:hypothetical protein